MSNFSAPQGPTVPIARAAFRLTCKSIAAAAVMLSVGSTHAAGFTLRSPDLMAGKSISPAQYFTEFGCTGQNARPALQWSGAPKGTKSFAVTMFDKDAPTGSGFWHWVVIDIAPQTTSIAANDLPQGAKEGNTDLGKPGYFGPCPPIPRKHNYVFTVHALDIDKLEAPAGATAALTSFFINQHSIGKATLPFSAGPRKKQ